MINSVKPEQAKEWLDKNEAMIIDVREPAEFQSEHIKGATSIPLSGLTAASLPTHQGKKLVFQCHSGKRSASACDKVNNLTGVDAYSLEGGISAWKQAGLATEKAGGFFLPLDRQVQLTVGLLLIFSSYMIYSGVAAFWLITGFLGIGLTFAGITGFCGLAMVLARMPWNQGKTSASCCATPVSH